MPQRSTETLLVPIRAIRYFLAMNGDEPNLPPVVSTPPPLPPAISEEAGQPGENDPIVPRWRWAIHLILFTAYVLGIGLISNAKIPADPGEQREAILPATSGALVQLALGELAVFAVFVAVALVFSRAGARQMLLKWRNGAKTLIYGLAYSVGLRLAIAILAAIVLGPILMKSKDPKAVEAFRPKTENLINAEALKDPVYLGLTVTLISFVVAGFREELWRAGMLAGLRGVAPKMFGCKKGRYGAVVIAAVIFGLGHLAQGPGAAALTGALGLGLGIIMVRHESIWEAVFAHGFFDATTFVLLYVVQTYFPGQLPGMPAALFSGAAAWLQCGS
jgi:membrane protease YdiL (CAAX protease family)